jgi:hypothetical protein
MLPGEQTQVDFGTGASILRPNGKRRPYVFRVVRNFSRKAYSEVGRQVWVRWDGHLVGVFNSKMGLLVRKDRQMQLSSERQGHARSQATQGATERRCGRKREITVPGQSGRSGPLGLRRGSEGLARRPILARPPIRVIQPCAPLQSGDSTIPNFLAWRRQNVYESTKDTGRF